MKVKSLTFLLLVLLSILNLAAQALDLEQKEQKEKEIFKNANNLFFIKKEREKAYKISKQLLNELQTDLSKSHLTYLISSYFILKNKPDSIVYYAKESLKFQHIHSDSVKRKINVLAKLNLANGYQKLGLYDKAIAIYIQEIDNQQVFGKLNIELESRYRLAGVYLSTQAYKKALKEYKHLYEHNFHKANIVNAMASIYSALGDVDKSDKFYEESISIDSDIITNFEAKIGLIDNLKFKKEIDQAIIELQEIIAETQTESCIYQNKFATRKLIDIFLEIGKYDDAEKLVMPLYTEDLKNNNSSMMPYYLERLSKIREQKGDYKLAIKYLKQFQESKQLGDSIQKRKELNELEVKYQTSQKQNEILLLKKDQEIKKQEIQQQTVIRNIILIGAALIIISILVLLQFYFQKLKTQKKLNETQANFNFQKIKALMKNQELELVKASIEGKDSERKRLARGLHDSIGNNMVAIKLQIEELPLTSVKLQKIKSDLNYTYEQIRELSHNLLPKKIRQNDYAEVLKEYIVNINEISDVSINLSVSQSQLINDTNKFLQNEIFAILQELISNTLKHARATKIDIQLEIVDTIIFLSYEDNGIGFNTQLNHQGIGLKSIKERIEQLSGRCIIDSHPKRGTLYRIELEKEAYLIVI